MNGRRALGALLACLFVCVAKGEDPLAVPKELKDVPASNFCKVVDETTSKDGRTAVAVGFLSPGPVDWAKFRDESGDYLLGGVDVKLVDFTVDLKKDRVLAVLRGTHPGTRSSYNHERYHIAWSEGGKYLVETESWRWHTAAATLYCFDENGAVASSMDVLPIAKEQLRIISERNHKITRQKFEGSYSVSLWQNSVDPTGRVTLDAFAEVPKSDGDPSISLLIQFTVKLGDQGKLSVENLEVKEKDEK